ncbi:MULTISPECIES: cell division protein SepF [Saliphagus]|uniref:Cell division protein SepF n=1 Tax=Saliphagus infecundisoli TaxID=1849069 RepID=A0ABD5QFY3_9EURY|nr:MULTISPECIES: cell division protein SepF [Saliphagus]
MGFMDSILGGNHQSRRNADDYVELDLAPADVEEAATQVHIAEIDGQASAIDIKDAVYDGDIVIADISHLRASNGRIEHVIDELRQVTEEVGGDIVQKGDDQIIVTPAGVHIGRRKLGGQ